MYLSKIASKLISLREKWLMPDNLKASPLEVRKARVLIFIHLFLFLICFVFDQFNGSNYPGQNPPLKMAMIGGLSLSVIFKIYGNFNLSGNLLAFFCCVILGQAVFTTGGLYSDNLLWMMAAPLTALLFANVMSGLVWLVVLIVFTGYLFYLDYISNGAFRQVTLGLDGLYYTITYIGLFVMVVGIVLIFATGQAMIIKALNEKQRQLIEQKAALDRQALSLKEAEEKLLVSNKELEQFAYTASHDLKEPLRMIGTYTQLIKRKLNGHLDGATGEYMFFVTDGVSRMDRLLTELLEYSRLGRDKANVRENDLNEVLFVVVNNLMMSMEETGAAILANELPVLRSTNTEMVQLFQNLISNSIKFRQKETPPVIEIIHSLKDGLHQFTVKDNGIGIPDEQSDRVFQIFHRLHSRLEYEGTGIGLATCKKIVNNLGGDITLKQGESAGTTFLLTIPVQN